MLVLVVTILRAYINRRILITLRNFFNSLYRLVNASFLLFTMSNSNDHNSSTVDPPPPFDPSQPSIPISYPIKTLEELESRAYFNSFHYPFNKSSVPLQNGALPNRPRLLVCHDMQGGYVDDKWVQGGSNADAYAIWHWHLMDVFVYFSHSLVSLPPPCWTNAAHTHGVKVLGTFITEWEEGRLISNQLLSTKESAHMYAERLAELAVALGFDGWLINMEVKLDVGQIPNMKEFVSHLTNTMHSLIPGSLVIWYDSVTIEGTLDWQDQLNEKNKPFFDICDGIFINYTWKEDYPKLSATFAGDRKFDVYMGIDVFGRNTFGGGQWNTNVALDVIKKDDVSAAIFAPGWVYETKQPPDFQTAQNRWWSFIEKSWGIVQKYPRVLPFYSNFDQGHGLHISVKGEKVLDNPWNNISSQGFQPVLDYKDETDADTIQVVVDFKEASYNGGGNITFKGTLKDNAHFIARLFQPELLLESLPVTITYSVKSEANSLLGLLVKFSSTVGDTKSLLVASSNPNKFSSIFNRVITARQVKTRETAGEWLVYETTVAMNGCTLKGIYAFCYKPDQPESRITPEKYYALLGHISISTPAQNIDFPPSTSWLVEGQHMKLTSNSEGSKTLSINIVWKLKDGTDPVFSKYNIIVKKLTKQEVMREYLGATRVEAFYVSDLVIPYGTDRIKFIIQACGANDLCQELDESPFLLLDI